MTDLFKSLNCLIAARDEWQDQFLAENEPDCQITTFGLEVIGDSTVERVQYGFCHRGWMETVEEVEGYDQYARFKSAQVGDNLKIEYLGLTKDPVVLTYIGGHTAGRGPLLNMDSAQSAGWVSIENITRGWKIDVR